MPERWIPNDPREEERGRAWQAAIADLLQIKEEIEAIRAKHPGDEGERIIKEMNLEAELAEAIKDEAREKSRYNDTLTDIIESSGEAPLG